MEKSTIIGKRIKISILAMAAIVCGFWIAIFTPLTMAVADDGRPLWLRYPAVSPDGQQIAFTYGGQIWRVASAGGEAVPLTSGEFYSTRPVWSPDGKKIVFASKTHGNLDLFIMPATGGVIKRLTYHSADDLPYAFSPDGAQIYFSSSRLGSPRRVPVGTYAGSDQLYTVPSRGGRTRMFIPTPALDVAASPDGKSLLYDNRPIYENEWRKGAVSDGTRDIWLYDITATKHRKLTTFRGEDRDATWAPDGRSYYYLSERSGSFNVWQANVEGDAQEKQITSHGIHPVRFLSIAKDGTMVYGYDGEIWRRAPGNGAQSQRVPIRISQTSLVQGSFSASANAYASELAVSPDGAQLAIVARGEVFVMSAVTGKIRRITNTPQHEASVSFGPDGKTLIYSCERDGDADIFEARIAPGAKSFTEPGPVTEVKLIDSTGDALLPAYAPDGQRIAYFDNRESIKVFDRRDGKTTTVLPKGAIYSYKDGDTSFNWSPDGRWIVSTAGSISACQEVVMLDATGKGAPVNLSRSGYDDLLPRFTRDGKAVIWLTSEYGLRSSDGNPSQLDAQITFLTPQAHSAFLAGLEGMAVPASVEKEAFELQTAGLSLRSSRLTPISGNLAFVDLSPDKHSVVFVMSEETGHSIGYRFDFRTKSLKQLFYKPLTATSFVADAKGENIYALGPLGIEIINLSTGAVSTFPITTQIEYDPRGEMRYLFDYFWRTTKLKFYRSDMHGVNWEVIGEAYRKFLPHINAWEDFADVLGEMAGQLNASHMAGVYKPKPKNADQTASLGLYFDETYNGAGMKILDVLPGGPADRVGSTLRPGALILEIDGKAIEGDTDLDTLLNHKVGVLVQLTVRPAAGGPAVKEIISPTSYANALKLAKERWIEERDVMVQRLSGGRLGYVYIEGMNNMEFQRAMSVVFGKHRDKEAMVIDIRFNGGGNLHDQLLAMFTGQAIAGFTTRDGQMLVTFPGKARWTKPSILMANAGSYSDGSMFPHVYKRNKVGGLVGTRVPGTGTAVWWVEVLNGQITYGIPQLGSRDFETGWFENQEVVPDELVYNDPDSIEDGRDPQLEAAVRRAMSGFAK